MQLCFTKSINEPVEFQKEFEFNNSSNDLSNAFVKITKKTDLFREEKGHLAYSSPLSSSSETISQDTRQVFLFSVSDPDEKRLTQI